MSRPRPLTEQQVAAARAMFEPGELPVTEVAKRSGIHYQRLLSLADKLGWVRQSSVEEITLARRIAGQGFQRRALEYLCSLIPTGNPQRDDEIVVETRRMALILSLRAADSARAAVRESESYHPARSGRAG